MPCPDPARIAQHTAAIARAEGVSVFDARVRAEREAAYVPPPGAPTGPGALFDEIRAALVGLPAELSADLGAAAEKARALGPEFARMPLPSAVAMVAVVLAGEALAARAARHGGPAPALDVSALDGEVAARHAAAPTVAGTVTRRTVLHALWREALDAREAHASVARAAR